jgi:hypothetical protein
MQTKKLKQHITVKELLNVIPDDKIYSLAANTQVDYCTKVLYGRSVFYMILYSLLESDRTSLRTMEDIFNSTKFKFLFNLDQNTTVRHSSISERLSVMDVSFFEQLFDHFYNQLSQLYSPLRVGCSGRLFGVTSRYVVSNSKADALQTQKQELLYYVQRRRSLR